MNKRTKFDRDFDRMSKLVVITWMIFAVLAVGSIVFIGWVIVTLLRFFGVI